MKRNLRLVSAAMVFFASGAVHAQSTEIPQELLELDRQRCLSECIPGFGEATCTPLCDCTVTEFKKRLDFSRYLELSAQLSRNELSPGNRTFLDTVAQYCTAELDKSGVQVGTGEDKSGEEGAGQ